MNKEDGNSSFNIDDNEEFSKNFYKNIENAFNEDIVDKDSSDKEENITAGKNETETFNKDVDHEYSKLKVGSYEEIDNEINGINAALARQICEEMGIGEAAATKDKKIKKKMPLWLRIQTGILITLLCLGCFAMFLVFTKPGNRLISAMGGKVWGSMTNKFEDTPDQMADINVLDEEDLKSTAPEINEDEIVWTAHPGSGRYEEGVYNVLLLGEEAIGNGTSRGRTDVMVIATLNTKTNKILLTSLMRDMLVQIPGYKDNKLNSVYEKGGLDLMYQTIALNFNIRIDGCVLVNFENFEKIIDRLGGLEITLTATEARYLNSTNYISKPEYRNVHEGTQMMNGNQVLGYSRVRKRATITGNNNDYGRTDRHRIVLNAIFEKYKTKSKPELLSIMLDVLPMLKTDIDNKEFEYLLNAFFDMGTRKIDQFRIPVDGSFTDNVRVRGMDVLIPDLDKNVDELHSFIFGDQNIVKKQ